MLNETEDNDSKGKNIARNKYLKSGKKSDSESKRVGECEKVSNCQQFNNKKYIICTNRGKYIRIHRVHTELPTHYIAGKILTEYKEQPIKNV